MGKADARSRAPPIDSFRNKIGKQQAKLGKAERTETQNKAIARKQEFPWQKLVLAMISFSSFCALLYLYLTYVLADDEEDAEEQAAAAAAAVRAAAATAAAAAAKAATAKVPSEAT